jgi:hypothetical protein
MERKTQSYSIGATPEINAFFRRKSQMNHWETILDLEWFSICLPGICQRCKPLTE